MAGLSCRHVFPGFDAPGCPVCQLWLKWPSYRRAVIGSPTPQVPAAPPARPCRHRGRELTGHERESRGLDHVRLWLYCDHAEQPLGPVVCGCLGCGPGCSGYPKEG
jgi:hypothetical protein